MPDIGQVVKATAKSGNPVERRVVAVIDPKFLKEQEQLKQKNGFAPFFVKDGVVYLTMTAPARNKLSDAEREKRENAKREKSEKWAKKRLAAAKVRQEKAEKAAAKWESKLG